MRNEVPPAHVDAAARTMPSKSRQEEAAMSRITVRYCPF